MTLTRRRPKPKTTVNLPKRALPSALPHPWLVELTDSDGVTREYRMPTDEAAVLFALRYSKIGLIAEVYRPDGKPFVMFDAVVTEHRTMTRRKRGTATS